MNHLPQSTSPLTNAKITPSFVSSQSTHLVSEIHRGRKARWIFSLTSWFRFLFLRESLNKMRPTPRNGVTVSGRPEQGAPATTVKAQARTCQQWRITTLSWRLVDSGNARDTKSVEDSTFSLEPSQKSVPGLLNSTDGTEESSTEEASAMANTTILEVARDSAAQHSKVSPPVDSPNASQEMIGSCNSGCRRSARPTLFSAFPTPTRAAKISLHRLSRRAHSKSVKGWCPPSGGSSRVPTQLPSPMCSASKLTACPLPG